MRNGVNDVEEFDLRLGMWTSSSRIGLRASNNTKKHCQQRLRANRADPQGRELWNVGCGH